MKKILTFLLIVAIIATIYSKTQRPMASTPTQAADDDLVLVNQQNPLNEEQLPTNLINLFEQPRSYELFSGEILLRPHVATALQQMIADANKEGLTHFIVMSGYRTLAEQQELYNDMGTNYAMKPGYSEHHTGLALDIGSTETTMDVAPEGAWLASNAWRYGFILRYPADKVAITGIEFEPWHLRFVGLPHSQIMYEQNLALEEYVSK